MGVCDAHQHGVCNQAVHSVQRLTHQAGEAQCFRPFDDGQEWARSIILPADDEPIQAGSRGVEQPVCMIRREFDVRDECQTGQPLLELANCLGSGRAVREEIDDGDPDRFAVARARERCPVPALVQMVPVANGRAQSLHVHGARQKGGDDTHATCRDGGNAVRRAAGLYPPPTVTHKEAKITM